MYYEPKISRNKALLLQASWWKPFFLPPLSTGLKILEDSWILYFKFCLFGSLLGCSIFWSRRTDHRGLYADITILGLNFIFNFYDIRHWDDETDKPKIYEDV